MCVVGSFDLKYLGVSLYPLGSLWKMFAGNTCFFYSHLGMAHLGSGCCLCAHCGKHFMRSTDIYHHMGMYHLALFCVLLWSLWKVFMGEFYSKPSHGYVLFGIILCFNCAHHGKCLLMNSTPYSHLHLASF